MNEMGVRKKQNSQSGQALIEYVLLLAISVALILGLMNQLYKPFGKWVDNYMGVYLECLLDVGELPSLGGGDASGECNQKFESFTLAGGRPAADRKNNQNSNIDEDARKEKSNGDSYSGGAYSGGRSGSSGAGGRGFAIGGSQGADGPGAAQGDGKLTEKLQSSRFFRFKSNEYVSLQQKIPSKGITEPLPFTKAKLKKKEPTRITVAATEMEGSSGKAKKLIVKSESRTVASEQEVSTWSFAKYLKYSVILLVIIAILLFLGGQIMQITKSMEK